MTIWACQKNDIKSNLYNRGYNLLAFSFVMNILCIELNSNSISFIR